MTIMMAEAVSRSLTSDYKQFASLSLSLNSSSAQAVISNHDLLSEILSYVPVRPLICFQLVSKQWLSLITSTQFALLHYRQRRWTSPPSAIFLESEFLLSRGFETHMLFVHLNRDKIHTNPFRYASFSHDSFDPKKVLILQSSMAYCCVVLGLSLLKYYYTLVVCFIINFMYIILRPIN